MSSRGEALRDRRDVIYSRVTVFGRTRFSGSYLLDRIGLRINVMKVVVRPSFWET